MKNTFTTPTDFWQERDFGAKISAVFEFIGGHWRPLGKCLVYFVLPGALLMGVGLGLFTNSFFNGAAHDLGRQQAVMAQRGPAGLFGLYNFSGLGLAFLGGLLAILLLIGTLHAYLRARLRLPAAEPVTPAEVWAELRVRGGRCVGRPIGSGEAPHPVLLGVVAVPQYVVVVARVGAAGMRRVGALRAEVVGLARPLLMRSRG